MTFDDLLKGVVADLVNVTQTPIVMCRSCDSVCFCPAVTIAEHEATTAEGMDHTVTTGQCDECLMRFGPDEHCDPPEVQDEAEARGRARIPGTR